MPEDLIFLEDIDQVLSRESLYAHEGLPPVTYPIPGVLYDVQPQGKIEDLVLFFILITKVPRLGHHYMREAFFLLQWLDLLGYWEETPTNDFEDVVCIYCGSSAGYAVGGGLLHYCSRCDESSGWKPQHVLSITDWVEGIHKGTGLKRCVIAGAWAKAIKILKENMNDAANPRRRDAPGSGLHGTPGRWTDYEGDL